MEEECLPSDHPDLSGHLNAIARTYKRNGDKEKALVFCEKQLTSQKALLGDVHSRVASTLMTIGDICDGEEHRQYYQRALSVLEKCTPRNELIIVHCLGTLGAIALNEGKLREGLAYLRHVLDIQRKIHSPDHPAIAKQPEDLGDACFKNMHDYRDAHRYYTESLTIFRANYDDEHSYVIRLKKRIEEVHQKMEN
jgi:tetratricopeptide (TPR) repeat protein